MITNYPKTAFDCDVLFADVFPDTVLLEGQTMLQIGGRPGRGLEIIYEGFAQYGYKTLDLLEIWQPNLEAIQCPLITKKILGDMRTIDTLVTAPYDVIVAWHSVEHISKEDGKEALAKMVALSNLSVIWGMPWGNYPQDAMYGNPNEEHKSHWQADELEALGFQVYTFGDGPNNDNMMFGVLFR